MKKRTLFVLLGLALTAGSAQATRVLEILERSYELALAEVTVPRSSPGSIGYKPCSDCAYEYMPVTGATTYYVGGQMVTLAAFNEEAARIRRLQGRSESTLVMLHYDPKSEVATRIRISSF